MITSMSDIICITNRKLCRGDFLTRIERIAAAHPRAIVLREKDLPKSEYSVLAAEVMRICGRYGTPCILHSFYRTAAALGAERIHLPLQALRELTDKDREHFAVIGASCHSVEDAQEAERLGAAYITLGHIFATDCKRGLAPRGLGLLGEVCGAVEIPVYAIGGISPDNVASVRAAGASGACIMSGLMTCDDPENYLRGVETHEI